MFENGVIKEVNTDEITVLEFLKRFTPQERKDIRDAAKVNDTLSDFMYLLETAQNVNFNSPELIAGMNLLVGAGLLSQERKVEILLH